MNDRWQEALREAVRSVPVEIFGEEARCVNFLFSAELMVADQFHAVEIAAKCCVREAATKVAAAAVNLATRNLVEAATVRAPNAFTPDRRSLHLFKDGEE